MKQAKLLAVMIALYGSLFLLKTSCVYAASYSFSVDRFEISGNLSGDFVDDFNGGSIGTRWREDDPTVVEADGKVTFKNPGYTGTNIFQNNISISFERTFIAPDGWIVANNFGDFQATSTWIPTIPGINQTYGIDIYTGHHDEGITMSVYNFGQDIADLFGLAPGIGIYFGRYEDVGEIALDMQAFSIIPTDISGDILLKIVFDDDNDLFTGMFSLDGGNSFQSPFSDVTPNIADAVYELNLGAESWEVSIVPLPGAFWLFSFAIVSLLRFKQPKY